MYQKVQPPVFFSHQGLGRILPLSGTISNRPEECPLGVDTESEVCYTVGDRVGFGIDTKEGEAMKKDWLIGSLLGVSMALLLALWAASSVGAIPSAEEQGVMAGADWSRPAQAEPTPVPGGPGYYSVGSVEMRPGDSTIGYLMWGGFTTTQESTIHPLGYTLYGAGLHLPQGARIAKLVAYGYDNDEAKGFYFGVVRTTVTDTATAEFVVPMTESDTDASPFVKEVAADEDFGIVDNRVYAYAVVLNLPAASSGKELSVFQFRVDYTFDNYVPLTMKEH